MLQYKVTIKKCQSRDYFQGDLGDLRGDDPADDVGDLPGDDPADDHGGLPGDNPADDLGDLPGDNPADDLEDLPLPQQDHVEPGVPDPEAEVPGDEGIYDQVITNHSNISLKDKHNFFSTFNFCKFQQLMLQVGHFRNNNVILFGC